MVDIPGTIGDDSLIGTSGNDLIEGFAGSDTLNGKDGNDIINPGTTPDGGRERIYGSLGNDQIVFSDTVDSDSIIHLIYRDLSGISVNINGSDNSGTIIKKGAGTDTLTDIGTALELVDFAIWGTAGNDVFTVNGVVDSYMALAGSQGNDTFNLTLTGEIRLIYDGSWDDWATQGVVINLATGVVANDGFGFTDTLNISNGTADDYLQIYASDLDDHITGSNRPKELFILAGGNDTLIAGDGYDQVRFDRDEVTSGVEVDLAAGTATGTWNGLAFSHILSGVEWVRGTDNYDDTLRGDSADEELNGYGGSDLLEGRAGDDDLYGGDGSDTLIGGSGRDYLAGRDGDDLLDASQGDATTERGGDFIRPGSGSNTILGNEVLFLAENGIDISYTDVDDSGGVLVTRTANGSATVLSVFAGVVSDTITFAHSIAGTFDNDLFVGQATGPVSGPALWAGSKGEDTIQGGIGDDLLFYDDDAFEAGTAAVSVTFTGIGIGTAVDGFGDIDVFSGVEGIMATESNDTLTGAQGEEAFLGLGGNDRLIGAAGNDQLYGGLGVDTLNGGDGDDTLFGGEHSGILGLVGFADPTLDLRDVIYGGDGQDSIDGGYGNDDLNGGNGNDTVSGDFGADTLIGNDGNDVLAGAAGADLMYGNAGNDFLNGGFGYDRLNGGTGADSFFHIGTASHGSDWVQDYNAAEGDILAVGIAGATRAQFQVNFNTTPGAGSGAVTEAFVIYRPTGQILWALIDGGDDTAINANIGGQVFDLLI